MRMSIKNNFLCATQVLLAAALSGLVCAGPVASQEAAAGQKPPHTVFGKDKRTTQRAMKAISKALGVKCTYCHLREGNKINYGADTPRKEVARAMKRGFVDLLASANDTTLTYLIEDRPVHLRAVYRITDDGAFIDLSAVEGERTVARKRIDASSAGPGLQCETCHVGSTAVLVPVTEEN